MSADVILRKLKRAMRNQTGATLTADQICELVDFGILEMLSAITNKDAKEEARARLEARASVALEASEDRKHYDRNWVAALGRVT